MAAGLVSYASSDDDEGDEGQRQEREQQDVTERAPSNAASAKPGAEEAQATPAAADPSKPAPSSDASEQEPRREPELERHEPPPIIGPVPQAAAPLGPSLPPTEAAAMAADEDQAEAPPSPYLANRALVHDLTLPSVPNLDMPPSPPGSPPPRASKNFEQFLALKKKGTHFNSKLEQSTALRNPSVMDKLMEFVELDGPKQYETTLPADLWDPKAFPESAFVEKLRRSRDRIAKEREADKSSGGRTSVEFVPPTTGGTGNASVAGGLAKGEKRRVTWK